MTVRPRSEPDRVPAALTEFLRGVERRGAVFAEGLCGDPIRGDAALAVAMRALCRSAAQTAAADWPHRFWSLLLTVPQLRSPADARWSPKLALLAGLAPGARAVVLLRLVAGLDDVEAAAVLGIAPATQRLALHAAQPRRADGSADAAAWDALANALQRALIQLSAERIAHITRLRQAAITRPAAASPARRPAPASPAPALRRGWLRPALWAGVAACVLGFGSTFLLSPATWRGAAPPIRALPLPVADAPASTFDADTAVLTHRDFELLADSRQDAVVHDMDFYAWYAAQLASQAVATPVLLPDAGMPAPDRSAQAIHAPE